MERYGKINAMNSGSESWTGIGVVAGCAVVMLITQGPHVQDIATYWRIKLLHILQEVGSICKTRNHLIAFGNELWERKLPGLLPMVGESAEFLRVQTPFTRHLDVQIAQVKALLG